MPATLPGTRGKVVSYTVIRVAPAAFAANAPYALAIVELEDGRRELGQIEDWQSRSLTVGAPVIVTAIDPQRGPRFRLALDT